MKISDFYHQQLKVNHDHLKRAALRLESLDTTELNLGDTCTAMFKTVTGIHPKNLVKSDISILKVLKRKIVFSINGVVFYSNKYGVIGFDLPSQIGLSTGLWSHSWHGLNGDADAAVKTLLDCSFEYSKFERIYDYSNCKCLCMA